MQLSVLSLGLFLSFLQSVQAVDFYLWPHAPSFSSQLSTEDASSALSHHLGLEMYESVRDTMKGMYEQENFVAQGQNNALVVTVDESDAEAVLPSSLQASFKLSTPDSAQIDSLRSVLSTYLHRARDAYSTIIESLSSKWDVTEVGSVLSSVHAEDGQTFAALDLSPLAALRESYGSDSDDYQTAVANIRSSFESLMEEGHVHLAVLTYTASPTYSQKKRQAATPSQAPIRVPPQHPIDSISTCFTSADSCNNATASCSGRGQCVEATKIGKTCFICACQATKTGKGLQVKTQEWVGQSCERKDVSAPFTLFVGSAIVMLVLAIGSVSFLYAVGEQPLPPTLTGTAVHAKKE